MFQERSGVLHSVDFPFSYPKSLDCVYRIEVEPGLKLYLEFDPRFDVEDHPDISCPYDHIKVKVTGVCLHICKWLTSVVRVCVVRIRLRQVAKSTVHSVVTELQRRFRPKATSPPSSFTVTTLERMRAGG